MNNQSHQNNYPDYGKEWVDNIKRATIRIVISIFILISFVILSLIVT